MERDFGGPAKSASDELPPHLLAASMPVSVRTHMGGPGSVMRVLWLTPREAGASSQCPFRFHGSAGGLHVQVKELVQIDNRVTAVTLGWRGKQSVEIEFRVLVPDLLVGSVIGRGGEVVRRIRAESDARVKVFEARGACLELSCHAVSLQVSLGVHEAAVALCKCLAELLKLLHDLSTGCPALVCPRALPRIH